MKTFLKKYWLPLLAFLLIVLLLGGYAFGFRVAPGGITRVGTLTLTNLPAGTSIFAEQVLQETTKQAGDAKLELVPGNHSIIVSAPNEYPWSSVVSVTSGADTRINPFLVGMSVKVTQLSGQDAQAALAAVASSTIPTEAAPLRMQNGCATVYISNNQVIEQATTTAGCTPPPYLCTNGSCDPTIIFAPISPITTLLPFPNRQDAVVVSFANSLYALSVNPTSPQFFAPLLRGTNLPLKFGLLPDGTIVFSAGTQTAKISL